MADFTNETKHSSDFTNQPKNGVAPAGEFDVALFDESAFDSTDPTIDITWTNQTKH